MWPLFKKEIRQNAAWLIAAFVIGLGFLDYYSWQCGWELAPMGAVRKLIVTLSCSGLGAGAGVGFGAGAGAGVGFGAGAGAGAGAGWAQAAMKGSNASTSTKHILPTKTSNFPLFI